MFSQFSAVPSHGFPPFFGMGSGPGGFRLGKVPAQPRGPRGAPWAAGAVATGGAMAWEMCGKCVVNDGYPPGNVKIAIENHHL